MERAVRGTDDQLAYARYQTAGPPGSFTAAPGLTLTGDPAAVGSSEGTLRIFARGTDNALYVNTLNGNGIWLGYTRVDGRLC